MYRYVPVKIHHHTKFQSTKCVFEFVKRCKFKYTQLHMYPGYKCFPVIFHDVLFEIYHLTNFGPNKSVFEFVTRHKLKYTQILSNTLKYICTHMFKCYTVIFHDVPIKIHHFTNYESYQSVFEFVTRYKYTQIHIY